MARTQVPTKRTVVDQLDALLCDLCGEVYAKAKPPEGGLARMMGATNYVDPPKGSGNFTILGSPKGSMASDLLRHHQTRTMELCEACAGVTWDWLQEQKKT